MALVKGTNSYVTVLEADAYFSDRLDATDWTSASAPKKAQALVTATAILDNLKWAGVAISADQHLAFPRSCSYFDPRVGRTVILDNTVPARIEKATKELAYHLLNNEGMLDDGGSALNIGVGSVNLTTIFKPNKIPAMVDQYIRPLLVNGGNRLVWRNN